MTNEMLELDFDVMDKFMPITENDMKEIILRGNTKSSALDPLPTKLLIECLDCLLPTLTKIVNMSISSSIMPDNLKTASVTPLLKKNGLDIDEFKNYRPVSNLPYLSKLIEKAVVKQLKVHLSNNQLEEPLQSAYKKLNSTETALIKIMNDFLCGMDRSEITIAVLLDQSAAFDTCHQDVLLNRLKHEYGITDSALEWCRTYFVGRCQKVCISGTSSNPVQLDTGFPQGSIFGPFAYPISMSPMFQIARIHSVSIHMYVDDTQLYITCSLDKLDECMVHLKACLQDIKCWMLQNHLKMNDSKTEVLIICSEANRKKLSHISSLEVGTECVEPSTSARNLGVFIDETLSMQDQVNYTIKACYAQLYRISKIRPFLTEEAAAELIRSLVLSKLDYCNSLLFGLPDCQIKKMQLVQNNAARLVYRKKKADNVTPLLKRLHWLPIEARIKFKIILLAFKAINNLAPTYLKELLELYEPARALRSTSMNLLKEKKSKHKRSGDRAFSVCAPKLWNMLPCDLRKPQKLNAFKSALKTHLFKEAYD